MATNTRKRSKPVKGNGRSAATTRSQTVENLVVVATNADDQAICIEQLQRLPTRLRSTIALRSLHELADSSSRSTLIVSRLADVSKNAVRRPAKTSAIKQVVFIDDLPIEAVTERLMALQIRSSQRLHIASKRDRTSAGELIYRLVSGMANDDGGQTIVDAWVEGEDLVLLSSSFHRMVVPSEKLTRFLGNNASQLASFEIDEDGRFLYWPHADAHLGWKQLQHQIDPSTAIEDAKKSDRFNERYGGAIRALRESSGLKQSDVVGLASRQLRRIEHGEQTVSKKALEALSAAHQIPIDEYLQKLATLASNT